jgi:hypothetical protein
MGIRIADATECLLHHRQQLRLLLVVEYSLLMQIMQLYNTLAPPNTNPVWVDLVQSGRSDFVANTIDFMNNLSDPRRAAYFDQNLGAGIYEGGPYGENNSFHLTLT